MLYSHRKKTYRYLGLLLVFIIVAHYVGILGPIERFFRSIITPTTTNLHLIGIEMGDSYALTSNRKLFLEQYNKYRQETEEKNVLAAQIKMLNDENIALKQQLEFKKTSQFKMVTAEVVGRDLDNINKTIIISQGSSSGVSVGQIVVANSGVLIGKVIKTEPDTAVVSLVSDSQTRVSALILNKERSLGAVEGGHGLSLSLKFIPRNETVTVGDQVVTSGFEPNVPRGILIGTVAVVENEAYKPFQQAVLNPATDLSKLIVVSVLVGS